MSINWDIDWLEDNTISYMWYGTDRAKQGQIRINESIDLEKRPDFMKMNKDDFDITKEMMSMGFTIGQKEVR